MSQPIAVGDNVAYTESFLDRNSPFNSNMPSALGKVKALHLLDRITLADIEWNHAGLPKRVNVKYLAIVALHLVR